jgi:hypothetical protein
LAALPTSQIDQIEDASQPIIDPPKNRKPPLSENGSGVQSSGKKKSVWPPIPCELTDALAELVIEVLPAIEHQLLEEGVISEPIPPEEVVPPKTIGCEVELRLGLNSEPKGPPSSAHFDSDPSGRFCRLLRIWLNICNPAMRACLKKRNVRGTQFFAGVALVRCVSRDRSALSQALVAELKTSIGLPPNKPISTASFARRLAEGELLAPIGQLPIFGEAFQNAIGRTFAVTEIDLRIPVAELGPPWNKPRKRRDPFFSDYRRPSWSARPTQNERIPWTMNTIRLRNLSCEDKEEIRRAEVLQYWPELSITRITFYSQRAVGSLSLAELESLSPWFQNVERLWHKADLEIKSHYWALQEALAQARAKQQTAQSEVQPESSESDLRAVSQSPDETDEESTPQKIESSSGQFQNAPAKTEHDPPRVPQSDVPRESAVVPKREPNEVLKKKLVPFTGPAHLNRSSLNEDQQTPPYSQEAEMALICSLLKDPSRFGDIDREAFFFPAHKVMFDLICQWPNPNRPVDWIWAKAMLEKGGLLAEVGGKAGLSELLGFVPSAAGLDHYNDIVKDCYLLRELITTCRQSAADCVERDADLDVILQKTRERIDRIAHLRQGSNGDEPLTEEKHVEFPLHCFPKVAQFVIKEVVRANRVPESLVGCSVLGIGTASLGAGIRVVSGSLRYARGNLFILAIGATGVGKDSAFRRVMTPLAQAEQEILDRWRTEMASVETEISMREQECERHIKAGARNDDPATKEASLRLASEVRAKIDELKKRMAEPCLSVADVTKEKLGAIMADQVGEAVASISAEARGIVDVLCGRYSNGASDEDFYTSGFSGTPTKVDRLSRGKIQLSEPCLTLLWMIQPDKFHDLLSKENITESGLPQRCLICDTHAEPQEETKVEIDFSVFDGWDQCIKKLIKEYRFRKEPVTIEPEAEAEELFRQYFNELVRRRRTGGDLHDIDGYAARWCEQAWHVAVLWHAINEGKEAPNRKLSKENATKAIELIRWFVEQELAVLGVMRSEQRQKRMDKLATILASQPDERCTLRNLRKNHGFDDGEVHSLADEYPHRLEVVVITPKRGRPSPVAVLKD